MGLSEVHRSRYIPRSESSCLAAFGPIYAYDKSAYKADGPEFDIQDTFGCGYDWEEETVFYTSNGKVIPVLRNEREWWELTA